MKKFKKIFSVILIAATLLSVVCISSSAASSVIPESPHNVSYQPYLSLRTVRLHNIGISDEDYVFTFNIDESAFAPSRFLEGSSYEFRDIMSSYNSYNNTWYSIETKSTLTIEGGADTLSPYRTAFLNGYNTCLYTPNQTWIYDAFILTPEVVELFSGDNINNRPYISISFDRNGYLPTEVYTDYMFTVTGVDKLTNLVTTRDYSFRFTNIGTPAQYRFGCYMVDVETMYEMITNDFKGTVFNIQSYSVKISTNGTQPSSSSSNDGTRVTNLVHFTNVYRYVMPYRQYVQDLAGIGFQSDEVGIITNAISFVSSAVASFFSFEILPGFNFGAVLAIIISVSVMLLVLKFFAGG